MTDAKTPSELASKAAEAIRDLNHATLGIGHLDWEHPSNAYSPLTYEASHMTGNNLAQSLPGIVSLGPNPELPTTPAKPTTTAWFKIAPGVFAEYAFDRGEFGAAMPNRTLVSGVATGRVQVNLRDAERVD